MPKRIQRQYVGRGDEECTREITDNKKVKRRETITNNNKPKKAGANMTNSHMDQEILAMLKQINEQLIQLQPQQNKQSSQQLNQAENQQNQNQTKQQENQEKGMNSNSQTQNKQQSEAIVSEELSKLFSQLLKGKPNQPCLSKNQFAQTTPESQNSNQSDEQERASSQGQNHQSSSGTVAVHTAAQVLAEAQYELANELDASLKKLKQVISESEKIANKISNLLGENNASNKQ